MTVATFTKSNDPRSPTDTIGGDKTADIARHHIDIEVQKLEDSIRSLKSRRNVLAPISRLPPEILSKIFAFCASENPSTGKPLHWIKVSHISRYWRAVALDSPSLWGNIVTTRPRWTEEMVKRSKMARLTLDADLSCVTPRIFEAVQLVLQHITRISDLRLVASSATINRLVTGLPIDAPFLESLSLSVPRNNRFGMDEDFTLPQSLFSGDISQLQHLELVKCNINWDSSLLTGLTVLKLSDIPLLARPTTSQLLDVLEKMPAMEILHLHEVLPSVDDETMLSRVPDRIIALPHLSHIAVISTVPECTNLFKHITIPSSVTFYLNTRGTDTTNQDFSGLFNSFSNSHNIGVSTEARNIGFSKPIHTLHIQFINPVGLVIQGWSNGAPLGPSWGSNRPQTPLERQGNLLPMNLGSTKAQYELNLSWRQYEPAAVEAIVIGACKMLSLIKLKSLRISHSSDVNKETWAALFGTLPRLQNIQLRGCSAETFIPALREEPIFDGNPSSTPTTPTGSQSFSSARKPGLWRRKSTIPPVCFPDLRTLTFEEVDFKDRTPELIPGTTVLGLMDCLMERAEKKAEVQELRLTACTHLFKEEVEELKEIVADVDWDGIERGGLFRQHG